MRRATKLHLFGQRQVALADHWNEGHDIGGYGESSYNNECNDEEEVGHPVQANLTSDNRMFWQAVGTGVLVRNSSFGTPSAQLLTEHAQR